MRAAKPQSGSILVELAVLLIPLLVLGFGITEFGRAVYQYNALAKSVRDGARHLSQYAPGDPVRQLEARSMVVCGATDCGGREPLVPGLSISHVNVLDRLSDPNYNLQSTGRGTLNLVRVQVTGFTFQSVAPAFVPSQAFGPIQATMVQVL